MSKHEITRVRRDSVRRQLRVASREQLTPQMVRIVFQSDELRGFDSPSPDDHIKLFFPAGPGEQPHGRDFTPRAWDLQAGTLTVDFALHAGGPHGPAADWARTAQPGDPLTMGGPRGSTVVPDDFDWYLLIGDATATPSFSRRLEALRPGVNVHVILLLAGPEEQPALQSAANVHVRLLPAGANASEDSAKLLVALGEFTLPPGEGYVWIAAEESVSRAGYRFLVETGKHPTDWIKASAYWTESKSTAETA